MDRRIQSKFAKANPVIVVE